MGNKAIVNHTSPALRTPIHSSLADPICSERVTIHCEWEENPQNCPFPLGFRHLAGEGPSHGHRQHAQKIGKDRACGYGDIARGQTDRQTCSSHYFATALAGEVIKEASLLYQEMSVMIQVKRFEAYLLHNCLPGSDCFACLTIQIDQIT